MEKSVIHDIKAFVKKIGSVKSSSKLFNMYYGVEGKPFRHNLKQYLIEMAYLKPTIIFLGEAAGPNGARRTGIPFTDEVQIRTWPIILGKKKVFSGEYFLPLAGDNLVKESSSDKVWSTFIRVQKIPLLWNAVPYHPHNHGKPLSIRTPSDGEVREYSKFIKDLKGIFPSIEDLCAIGRKAQIAIVEAMDNPPYMKHPSRFPKEFISKAEEILAG